jgi:hypothetical protein
MAHKDPKARRAYEAAYRAANVEKVRATQAAYRATNREKERARSAAYRAAKSLGNQ